MSKPAWKLPPDTPADWNPVAAIHARRFEMGERMEHLLHYSTGGDYCWWVPTVEALVAIGKYGPILSMGAGTGYAEQLLRLGGIEVVAVDRVIPASTVKTLFKPGFGQVLQADERIIPNYSDHSLALFWPDGMTSMASDCLRLYAGRYVLFIGISPGHQVRTGDPAFHRMLAKEWKLLETVELPHWADNDDNLYIYERNS
jgi:hypothetical protein